MPIYEYVCETCGERFETMQRMSDPPLRTCGASCRTAGDGAGSVRRVMSVTNVGGTSMASGGSFDPGAASCGRCGRPGPGCES